MCVSVCLCLCVSVSVSLFVCLSVCLSLCLSVCLCSLFWSNHVTALCKSISKKNCQLSKIKHFLNLHARKLFLHAHIQSIIDYGSTLRDLASANTLKPLANLHKRALKAILPKNTTITISDNNFLSILPLKERLFNYNNDVARPPCCIPLKSFPF